MKKHKLMMTDFNYAFFEKRLIEDNLVKSRKIEINRARALRLIKSMEVSSGLKK